MTIKFSNDHAELAPSIFIFNAMQKRVTENATTNPVNCLVHYFSSKGTKVTNVSSIGNLVFCNVIRQIF